MRIGSLNKRIELQYATKSPDGAGGFSTSYVVAATVYAAVWPTSANEVKAANAVTMVVSHRIRIRYRSGIKSNWRLKMGNRYFNIVSIIDPSEGHKFLDIMCKEAA